MSMIRPGPMPPKLTKSAKKPRRRLRQVSDKKAYWRRLYFAALAFLVRLDPFCRKCRVSLAQEGHHPFGQIGALILIFWPMCRSCHEEIENHKKRSREEGWILYH